MRREDWNQRYAVVDSLWARRPNRFLVAEVEGLTPGRALDLACGEGQNAIWLATRGWEVTGVDFSDVALTKARARAEESGVEIDLVCADLVTYEPASEAFDLVVVLYLHIPADQRRLVLGRAAAAVAPGGTFLFVGHDARNPLEGIGGPSDPSLLSTPDEIAGELAGLEIERTESVLRDVEGEDRPAIDTLVRAWRPCGQPTRA